MAGEATQLLDEPWELQLDDSDGIAATPHATVAYLDVLGSHSDSVSASLPLRVGRNIVGREPDDDDEQDEDVNFVRLDQPSVSGQHAVSQCLPTRIGRATRFAGDFRDGFKKQESNPSGRSHLCGDTMRPAHADETGAWKCGGVWRCSHPPAH